MKIFFSTLILLFAISAQALPTVLVRGVVVSFDNKKIVLVNGKNKINVPRSSYPDLKKISVGHSVIEVRMTPQQMYELNPPRAKKSP